MGKTGHPYRPIVPASWLILCIVPGSCADVLADACVGVCWTLGGRVGVWACRTVSSSAVATAMRWKQRGVEVGRQ